MKKLLTTTIIAAMIASLGAAFAQSQQHQVEVRVPNLLMIRLTMGPSNATVDSPSAVLFDLLSRPSDSPLATPPAINGVAETPGNVWDNVRVFANSNGWDVEVTLSNPNTVDGVDFPWNQVAVTPLTGDGHLGLTPFNLPATGSREIVTDGDRTTGWASLGFGPAQFGLTLSGNEVLPAGTYTVTVIYTISNP